MSAIDVAHPAPNDDLRTGDPIQIVRNSPTSPFQFVLVAMLFLLYMLDGYDILAMAFALPGIRSSMGLKSDVLGFVISAGLIGTGAGSFFLAPLADRFGRRPIMLVSLIASAAGMVACAAAGTVTALFIGRLLTGVGVGGLLPGITALAAEYSNDRVRNRITAFITVGFSAGGLMGGAVSSILLSYFTWRSVFVFGAIGTGSMAVIAAWIVPESIEFMARSKRSDCLARVNAVLSRMGHAPLQRLTFATAKVAKGSMLDIFKPTLLLTTLLVTFTYAFHGATFYYSVNWLPKIAVDIGYSAVEAARISAWCSAGGIAGSIVVSALAARIRIRALVMGMLLASALALVALAMVHHTTGIFFVASGLLGLCLYGGQSGLYAYMMEVFPTHTRATGAGFVTGLGRLGGIISPTVAGVLFATGMNNMQVSASMALGSISGVVLLILAHLQNARSRSSLARL